MLVSLSSVLESTNGLEQVCVLYAGKNQSQLERLLNKVCSATSYRVFNTSDELDRLKRVKFPLGTSEKSPTSSFSYPSLLRHGAPYTLMRIPLHGLICELCMNTIWRETDRRRARLARTHRSGRQLADSRLPRTRYECSLFQCWRDAHGYRTTKGHESHEGGREASRDQSSVLRPGPIQLDFPGELGCVGPDVELSD